MKQKYKELFKCYFIWLGMQAVINLVIDLFKDGAFVALMTINLITTSIIMGIAFLIQAFKINYKIIKRGK